MLSLRVIFPEHDRQSSLRQSWDVLSMRFLTPSGRFQESSRLLMPSSNVSLFFAVWPRCGLQTLRKGRGCTEQQQLTNSDRPYSMQVNWPHTSLVKVMFLYTARVSNLCRAYTTFLPLPTVGAEKRASEHTHFSPWAFATSPGEIFAGNPAGYLPIHVA